MESAPDDLQMRVETAYGTILVSEAPPPPGALKQKQAFVAYWSDSRNRSVYLFERLLFTLDDLGQAVERLAWQRSIDPCDLAEANPTLQAALSAGGPTDNTSWQPATVRGIFLLLGYDPTDEFLELAGFDPEKVDVRLAQDCETEPVPPAAKSIPHWALADGPPVGWTVKWMIRAAGGCPDDRPPAGLCNIHDPCCGNPDPCCGDSNRCCNADNPCCGSPDPCCNVNDPCCGNSDRCCNSDNPCCGSPDPCCNVNDPCCGDSDRCCNSDNPCCGSENPCCNIDDPCCGNPDPCCNSDNPDCGECEVACCNSPDPCCNNSDPCDPVCGNPCAPGCLDCFDGDPCTTDGCTNGSCWHEPKCAGQACCQPTGVCCPAPGECCDNGHCCDWPCEQCIDSGELTGGTITIDPGPVVCLDDTITFTLDGVVDKGGITTVNCFKSEAVPPVPPTYTWTITKPDASTINGSGPVASVVADVPGEYSCLFTASAARACPPAPIDIGPAVAIAVQLELTALGFDSEHGLMRDNSTNYEPTGDLFSDPEWIPGTDPPRNYPISHTMNDNVAVTLIVNVAPANAPAMAYDIEGISNISGFSFCGTHNLDGGINIVEFTSTNSIEAGIQKLTPSVQWTFERHDDDTACLETVTGPHTVYVTMNTPLETGNPLYRVTTNRMERAVEQAGAANSVKPHEIVKTVIRAQTFSQDEFAEEGQAWTVPDIPGGVDCQSIVRFGRKVVKQIGCPGTFDHVNIYAIETDPTNAIEDDPLCEPPPCPCCGLNSNSRQHPTNPEWMLSLIGSSGGCNPFEATAKFTYCGETRYYPAGTDKVYAHKDDVLFVLDTMSWVVEADFPGCTLAPVPHVFEYTPKPPNATVPDCR